MFLESSIESWAYTGGSVNKLFSVSGKYRFFVTFPFSFDLLSESIEFTNITFFASSPFTLAAYAKFHFSIQTTEGVSFDLKFFDTVGNAITEV